MARWQIILIVLNILSTTYVGAMQYFEKDTFGESYYPKLFTQFTVENRPILAICFGVLTGVLSSIIILLQPYSTRQEFRDSLMDGIFEQVLDNDKNKARITLFHDAGLLKSLWYKLKDFVGLWRRGWKLSSICKYCWEAKYIKIYKRWGQEHKKSKTYFCYSTETFKKCQGVAGQVRQREEKIVVELPNLSEIDLITLGENDSIVQEYMKKGHISDFWVLQSLKKLCPFIYGNIISVDKGKKKMVLVIDSCAKKTPFTRSAQSLLSTYVKQISASFGS